MYAAGGFPKILAIAQIPTPDSDPDPRYPRWKYFQAIKKYIGMRRLEELRHKVQRGLVSLDPVCR